MRQPNNIEYKRELAQWFKRIDWNLWATFTFKYKASEASAMRAMKSYANTLRKLSTDGKVKYVVAVEDTGDNVHLHALIKCSVDYKLAQAIWVNRYGIAKVRNYSAAGTATRYLTKNLGREDTTWDIAY